MTPERENFLQKIRKAFALAADENASEQERDTATRQAEALMRKHGIDEAEALASNDAEAFIRDEFNTGTKTMPGWMNVLSVAVGYISETGVQLSRGKLTFFGTEADVEFAKWLYRKLCQDINRWADESWQSWQAAQPGTRESARGWKGAFRYGCATRVQIMAKRLAEERDKAFKQHAESRALAPVTKAVRIAETFGLGGYAHHSYFTYSAGGYKAGEAAADRARFGRPIGGGAGTRRLI